MERFKNMAEGTNNPEITSITRISTNMEGQPTKTIDSLQSTTGSIIESPEVQGSITDQTRPSEEVVTQPSQVDKINNFVARIISDEELYDYLASQQLWPANFNPSDKSIYSTMSMDGPFEVYYNKDDDQIPVARRLKYGPGSKEMSLQNFNIYYFLHQQQTPPKEGVDLSKCKQSQEGPYVIYTDHKTHEVVARLLLLPISGGAERSGEEGGGDSRIGRRRELGVDEEWIRAISPTAGEIVFAWPKRAEDKVYKMREILLNLEKTSGGDESGVMKQALQELVLVINALMVDSKDVGRRRLGSEMYRELTARVTNHSAYMSFISEAIDGEKIHGVVKSFTSDTLNFFYHNPLFWEAFLDYDQKSRDYLLASRTGNIGQFNGKLQVRLYNKWVKQIMQEVIISNDHKPEERRMTDEEIEKEVQDRVKEKKLFIQQEIESVQINAERQWQLTLRRVAKEELVNADLLTPATEEDKKKGNVSFLGNLTGGNFAANKGVNFINYLYKQIGDWKLVPEQVRLMDGVDLGFKEFFAGFPGAVEGYWKKILQDKYLRNGVNSEDAKKRAAKNSVVIAQILTGVEATETVKDGEIKYEWPKRDLDISKFKWDPESWNPDKISEDSDQKKQWTNDRKIIEGILQEAFPDDDDPRRAIIPSLDFGELFGYSPFSSWGFLEVNRPDAFRKALTEDGEKGLIRNPTEETLLALGGVIDIRWEDKARLLINTIHFLEKHNQKIGRKNYNFALSNNVLMNALGKRFISKDQFSEVDIKTFGLRRFLVLTLFFDILGFLREVLSKSLEQVLKPSK